MARTTTGMGCSTATTRTAPARPSATTMRATIRGSAPTAWTTTAMAPSTATTRAARAPRTARPRTPMRATPTASVPTAWTTTGTGSRTARTTAATAGTPTCSSRAGPPVRRRPCSARSSADTWPRCSRKPRTTLPPISARPTPPTSAACWVWSGPSRSGTAGRRCPTSPGCSAPTMVSPAYILSNGSGDWEDGDQGGSPNPFLCRLAGGRAGRPGRPAAAARPHTGGGGARRRRVPCCGGARCPLRHPGARSRALAVTLGPAAASTEAPASAEAPDAPCVPG